MQIDALTGAPRVVERLDGFLTAPSSAAAASIARGYLTEHAALFATTASGVAALQQTSDTVDVEGTHHVAFGQRLNQIPIFNGGVKVNVAADGRIINVLGSPISAVAPLDAAPTLTAEAALGRALADGGASMAPPRAITAAGPTQPTRFARSTYDSASLVWFNGAHGLELGLAHDRRGRLAARLRGRRRRRPAASSCSG